MRKFTKSLMALALLVTGWSGAYAQSETDVTTLTWVTKGQDCTLDFNNPDGGTVFGTDAGGTNISYVDVSAYGTITLYGTASQTARLFINREEAGDNGIFFVDLNSEGVGVFDCNTVLTKQPTAQYIHLNGVKASAWNTKLNLSKITVSGSPITFPEPDPFVLLDGEVEITSLPWVNEGQGCAKNFGIKTTSPIYGTDAGPSEGNLSYIDATNYTAAKLWGPDGTVRLFINRAEYAGGTFQFYVTISGGVGTLNFSDVFAAQDGATYIHINGVKASSPGAEAQVDHITLVEKTTRTLTVGTAGYATFAADKALNLDVTGVEAYAAVYDAGVIKLTPVTAVPANTAVIVKAAANTYEFPVIKSADAITTDLEVSNGSITGNGSTIYALANGGSGVGFYLVKSGDAVPAGKAYLVISAGARDFIGFEDATTGIRSIETVSNNRYYNLQGVEVAQPTKGLYIVNGKKVVIK